jgi:hypothetical protein
MDTCLHVYLTPNNAEDFEFFSKISPKTQKAIACLRASVAVEDMPYVYAAGKVRVSASQCRVCIREIELKSLEDE